MEQITWEANSCVYKRLQLFNYFCDPLWGLSCIKRLDLTHSLFLWSMWPKFCVHFLLTKMHNFSHSLDVFFLLSDILLRTRLKLLLCVSHVQRTRHGSAHARLSFFFRGSDHGSYGICNLHDRLSVFLRGQSTCMPGVSILLGIFSVHDRGLLFLRVTQPSWAGRG